MSQVCIITVDLTLINIFMHPIIIEFITSRNLPQHTHRKYRFHWQQTTAQPHSNAGAGQVSSESHHHQIISKEPISTLESNACRKRAKMSRREQASAGRRPWLQMKKWKLFADYMIICWRGFESAYVNKKKDSIFYPAITWQQTFEWKERRLSFVGSARKNILYFNNNRNPLQVSFPLHCKAIFTLVLPSFTVPRISQCRMSIENCPVLHPTWKEFKNFSQYVEKMDRLYKKNYGMVKVVPPPEWKAVSSAYHSRLNGLMVSGPIEQNIFGKGGVYECLHIQKKSLSLKEYKDKMGVFDKITDGLTPDQVEDMFWKNIVFSPPLYGADLLSTLMDEKAGPWNLSALDSILKYSINSNVRGVTTPYCYVGSWKTLFCWHKEDLDLSAINYVHEGKSKFWYSIPVDQAAILERQAKTFFPEHFSRCGEHLRHKTTLFNPYNIIKKYPTLKISKTEHKPGEFMLVFGGSYHCGFNFGFNIAEAVNYATVGWLGQLVNCKYCHCTKSSVRASFREVLDNLMQSPYCDLKQIADLKKIVEYSEERELEEEAKVDEIKGVRLQFSKKIKKEKKLDKFKFKGEEYQIDNWAACDKCGQWRKLQKKLKESKSFQCEQIGKKCALKQRLEKDYITL